MRLKKNALNNFLQTVALIDINIFNFLCRQTYHSHIKTNKFGNHKKGNGIFSKSFVRVVRFEL